MSARIGCEYSGTLQREQTARGEREIDGTSAFTACISRIGTPLQYPYAPAFPGQQDGKQHTHRAGTDNEYIAP